MEQEEKKPNMDPEPQAPQTEATQSAEKTAENVLSVFEDVDRHFGGLKV